ncbi:MAG: T9SS type A sorting domain-containing protein [Bacteroidota bacterium]|nr:T9SS type A sorting domain-containing protein [Bacteroidota bacterium]
MLKTVKVSILFFAIVNLAKAQITITQSDMPSNGDQIIYTIAQAQNTGFSATKTGSNQTWDFSKLVPTTQDVYNFKSSLQTSYLLYFFNTIGLKTQDSLNLFIATFYDIYDFYKKNKDKWSIVGRGFTYSKIPLPANFTKEDIIYKFPLNYGDIDSNEYAFALSDPTGTLPISFKEFGTRVNTVDGWGSLTTPYGNFDCVRVKSKITYIDSIKVSNFSFGIPGTRYEYKWLTNGEKIPILQIDGTEVFNTFAISSVKFRDNKRDIKPVADFQADKTNILAGQPVNIIDKSTNTPTSYIWDITPSKFHYINGSNAGNKNISVVFDTFGNYNIKLIVANNAGTSTRTKSNYISASKLAGIEDAVGTNNFLLYPNPSIDKLYVRFSQMLEKIEIELYDLTGRKVMTQNFSNCTQTEIEVNNLTPGMYIVQIKSNKFTESQLIKVE